MDSKMNGEIFLYFFTIVTMVSFYANLMIPVITP